MALRALLTDNEVAQVLGVTAQTVRAKAAEFTTEPASGPSGNGVYRRMFDVASLPADAQVEWARRNNVVQLLPSPGQSALSLTVPTGPSLSVDDRVVVEQRYKVIEALLKPTQFRTLWAEHGNSKTKLIDHLAVVHNTKRRTIYNWLTSWKKGGLPALVPKDRSDKGKPKSLNPAALDFLVAAAFPKHGAYGQLTVRDIYRAYGEERAWRAKHAGEKMGDFERGKYARYLTTDGYLAPSAQLPEASYSTFRDWYNRIPEVARVMAREGVEAFSNSQEIISFRDIAAVEPLEYVVMDHRRLDIFCMVYEARGKKWKLIRPWLTAAIDMRTRKWVGWAIVETPSSDSIASVLKRVFLDYGLPVACYWDNGRDFRCQWLEGRTVKEDSSRLGELETGFRGVLDTLGIRVHHAIVKRARAKIIEPNFGRVGDFDRTLPWWCGHNASARPTERVEKLLNQHERWLEGAAQVSPAFPTLEQVADIYTKALKDLNERPMENAEGMNKIIPGGRRGWMCPNEAWELLIGRVAQRYVPEDVLHLCFAKRREITVQHSEIKTTFGGQTRHYRMPNEPVRLAMLNGCTVEFAYDPLDLQSAAIYHEGRLVGIVECIELRKMGEDAFVEDEKQRRNLRRQTKEFIAAVHQSIYVPDHEVRHARRTVEPRKAIPAPQRTTTAIPVPAAVVEAAEELARDRQAPFEAVAVERVEAPAAATDDEFQFFS